jgi:hypothetical protein
MTVKSSFKYPRLAPLWVMMTPWGKLLLPLVRIFPPLANRPYSANKSAARESDYLEFLNITREVGDREREFFKSELQKQGADAVGLYQRAEAFYDQIEAEYRGIAGRNPAMAQLWERSYTGWRSTGLNTAVHHEATQGQVEKRDATESLVASKVSDAGLWAHNLDRVAENLDEVARGIRVLSPGRNVDSLVLKAQTAYLDAAFQQLAADRNLAGMEGFLNRFANQMNPNLYRQLKDQYDRVSRDARLVGIYNDVLGSTNGDMDSAIKKLDDPEYRPDLELSDKQTVRALISTQRAEEKRVQAETAKAAEDQQNKALVKALLEGKLDVPAITRSNLDAKQQMYWLDVKRAYDDRARREAQNRLTEKDKADERAAVQRLQVKQVTGGIVLADYMAELKYLGVAEMKHWGGKLEEKPKGGFREFHSWAKDAIEKAEMLFSPTDDDSEAEAIEKNKKMQKFVSSFEAELEARNISPTSREAMTVADELMMEIETNSDGPSWFDMAQKAFVNTPMGWGGKPYVELMQLAKGLSKNETIYLFEIPDEPRRKIINHLKSKGMPVTGSNVITLYQQLLGGAE